MKKIAFLTIALWTGVSGVFGQTKEKMKPETLWLLGRVSEVQISPDGKMVLYGVTRYNLQENKGNRDLYVIPVAGGEAKQLTNTPGGEYNAVWRPDGQRIGYLSAESGSMQIWEMNADGSGKKQVSSFSGDITGFSYSPDSKNVLFTSEVKLDKTVNDLYPDLPKANALLFDDLMYRHWDNWTDYSYSHIFVAPYTDGKVGNATDIMKDERYDAPLKPWGGMDEIAWSADGSKIAYDCKKLVGKDFALSTNSDIYVYDLALGKTENISKFNPGYDRSPVFSHNGKFIVWKSMAHDGFESDKDRIMVYDFASKKATDYSEGFDQSSSSFLWSGDDKTLYFISGINATYQIFMMDVASKKISQITKGVHDYTEISLSGEILTGARMAMSEPTELFIINQKDGSEKQLTNTNKDVLAGIEMGKVEERWIPTTDGKKMLVWVIYPPFFDKNKKYPALLYCQGGPQSAVSQFFSYRWNFQMMAAHDYIVVAPNRRGLPTFGQEWNDQISQDYGGQNMNDYLSAIDAVAKEPFVDAEHLGAVGASYGGFSVYWLAGNHNKRFKAFIAHCGMYNLESQYSETEEFFFVNWDLGGPYWKKPKPKSYDFSPHNFVGNWDTPILVVSGEYDFRIPYTQSMQAFNAAQLQGVPSQFLLFPEESHFVLKPQNSVLWQRVFFEWLDKWLKVK
ncbi:MAG: S9 family peptidase [Bacteroidetes bacterium]|nr:S9 family peptidase [Bacteroidota bacterium]MBU1717566.1 S9 family peptidase [Bacteroidota bacterium]